MQHCCGCKHDGAVDGPMAVLKQEHRVIERVLDAAERIIEEPAIDRGFFLSFVDFVRNFADGCHHHKEEDQLFPMLEQAGMLREGGPIGCMLDEHERGRTLIRAINEYLDAAVDGDESAARTVRFATREYVALLRLHIRKEDDVLFALADQILDPQRQAALMARFDHVETVDNEPGKHGRYVALAEQLHRRAFAGAEAAQACAVKS